MPSIYNSADVLVLPSIVEPVGISAIEAISCGLPVVLSSVGGLQDIAVDGYNGFLFSPGNVQMLTNKLAELISDQNMRLQFASNSRRRAVDLFEYKKVCAEVRTVLSSLVDPA